MRRRSAETKPGPPPVLTKRGADILVRVEKLLDDAGKTATKASANERPAGQAASRAARSPSRRTMRAEENANASPRARTDPTRAADPDHIDRPSARDRGRPWRDLDDDDARHRDRRADDRPLDRPPRPAPPTSTPIRAPRSRATASCRSAPATASPSPRPRRQEEGARRPLRRRRQRRDAAGALLDADAVRPQGPPRRQFAAALRLHQPGDHPQADGTFEILIASRSRPATGCRPAASSATR